MASQERQVQHELLVALYEARKRVAALEAALARQEAIQGEGVEREETLGAGAALYADASPSLMQYIGLVETEEDISDFIGSEGHEANRPRLGPDAPPEVLPDKAPSLHPMVSRLVDGHPDDMLSIDFSAVSKSPGGADDELSPHAEDLTPVFAGRETAPDAFSLPPEEDDGALPDAPACFAWDGRYDEECLRSCPVLRLCHEGVWDWDLPSGELYASSRWREIVGARTRRRGESPLETFVRQVHPVDRAAIQARFDSLLSGDAKMVSMELRFKRSETAWGWGVLLAVGISAGGKLRRIITVLRDITEQRKTEIALRAEGELFRALTGDSPDVVGCFDRQGRVLSISPNFSRYCACLPEQAAGKHLHDLGITGEVALFEENLRQVFEVSIPFQEEIRLFSPLAGDFSADCRFQPEFGGDGNVSSVAVVLRDMTSSRRMKDNYHALLNAMDDGFVLLEHDTGLRDEAAAYGAGEFAMVSMNPAFGRMFFLKASKAVGKRLDEIMGEDARAWADCLRRALTEKRPVRGLVSVAAQRFALIAYSPENGRVACVVTREVAEGIRPVERQGGGGDEALFAAAHSFAHMDDAAEEDVARFALEQARSLTRSRLAYLYVTGESGRGGALYWSGRDDVPAPPGDFPPLVRELSRRGRADFLTADMAELENAAGGRAVDIFGGECAVARYMLAPALDEGNIACMAAVADKDGDYEPDDLRRLILLIADMWICLRRRRNLLALRRAKEEAETASRAKSALLNAASHSLRTPLNSVLGMLQALQQSPLSETQQEWLLTADYSGLSLLRGISDLLDFVRIETDAVELAPRLFDLPATVRSALAMFAHQAQRKNIRFKLDMDEAIPGALLGDDARVRQIVTSMTDNAFKSTARGGIRVECALLPRRKDGKVRIFLEVRDTGAGMPREALEDISRAFAKKGAPYAGTGVGLAVAGRLADLMGGSFGMESVIGRGSIVYCSLPFDEPRQLSSDSPSALAAGAGRSLDVLVAGEDPSDQFALRAILHQAGHTSICVGNGRQALEALMLRSFDCLITDMRMPVLDGEELLRRLRAGDAADIRPGSNIRALLGVKNEAGGSGFAVAGDLPVVALIPGGMEAERERALALGADYCLARPVFAADLAAILGHMDSRPGAGNNER
jgi:signal transduction histidine kinase/PAS domain-containing protein/CheY-like chemotaxis protein